MARTDHSAIRHMRDHRPAAATLAVAAFCLVCFAWIDIPVARWISLQDEWVHATFRPITQFGLAGPYFMLFAGALALAWGARFLTLGAAARTRLDRIVVVCIFVLAALILAGVATQILKVALGRWRPNALIEFGAFGFSPINFSNRSKSFPSGHAQLIWTVAVSLILVAPRYAAIYIAAAIVISASRVALNDHYVSDIVFGAYLGGSVPILLKRHVYDARGIRLRLGIRRRQTAISRAHATVANRNAANVTQYELS